MAMKLIKKTADYKIFMRGDERYAVQDANGKPINGEEKVNILVAEDLIKVTVPSPKEEAPAEAEDAGADEGVGSAGVSSSEAASSAGASWASEASVSSPEAASSASAGASSLRLGTVTLMKSSATKMLTFSSPLTGLPLASCTAYRSSPRMKIL